MCCDERPVDQTDFVSGVYKYNSLPRTLFPKVGLMSRSQIIEDSKKRNRTLLQSVVIVMAEVPSEHRIHFGRTSCRTIRAGKSAFGLSAALCANFQGPDRRPTTLPILSGTGRPLSWGLGWLTNAQSRSLPRFSLSWRRAIQVLLQEDSRKKRSSEVSIAICWRH